MSFLFFAKRKRIVPILADKVREDFRLDACGLEFAGHETQRRISAALFATATVE